MLYFNEAAMERQREGGDTGREGRYELASGTCSTSQTPAIQTDHGEHVRVHDEGRPRAAVVCERA
jgi:hypothetical protein